MAAAAKKKSKKQEISLEKLLETGAHFGHLARRWNPRTKQYIFTKKEGTLIFDLLKTKDALEEALEFLTKAASEGKVILLLGTKKQASSKVIEVGKELGIPFIGRRWLGGTFTNFSQIKRSIARFEDLKAGMKEGKFKSLTKKERLLIQREIDKFEESIGGIVALQKPPEVLVIVDTNRERSAVREAIKMNVTSVGIVDSNANPDLINYPIPMNDDAEEAVHYVLDLIKEALKKGLQKKKK